jgi:hypothetical protein
MQQLSDVSVLPPDNLDMDIDTESVFPVNEDIDMCVRPAVGAPPERVKRHSKGNAIFCGNHVQQLSFEMCSVLSNSELPVEVAPPERVKRHNMGTARNSGTQVVIGPDVDMQAEISGVAPPIGVKEHRDQGMHDFSGSGPIIASVQQGLPELLGANLTIDAAPSRVKRYSKKTTHDEQQGGPTNTSKHLFKNVEPDMQVGASSTGFSFSGFTPNSQTPCRGKGFASKRKSTLGYRRAAKRAKHLRTLADDPIQAIARLRESVSRPLLSDGPAESRLEQGKKVGIPHIRDSAAVDR